jgi:signal transduction histidine kinase
LHRTENEYNVTSSILTSKRSEIFDLQGSVNSAMTKNNFKSNEDLEACFADSTELKKKQSIVNEHNDNTRILTAQKELLEKEDLSMEERNKYHAVIEENAEKLNSLVSNVLKLNKLENQVIVKECEIFDLGELVCESLLAFESIWTDKNIEIETNLEERVFINTDKRLLEIVCNNLISNALKFTENGGKVFVSCFKENGFASICIQDTGCGISKETGKHIFEKFYQGDTSHKEQGNGLGLALVKRIIDVLGAEISINSELGKGSTFIIKIKL